MPKITLDIPEDLNRKLKAHKLKYNFDRLPYALIDVLERYFKQENYDFFLKNKEKK
jgi:hypothetical protein